MYTKSALSSQGGEGLGTPGAGGWGEGGSKEPLSKGVYNLRRTAEILARFMTKEVHPSCVTVILILVAGVVSGFIC
jgi:hypothetical protein